MKLFVNLLLVTAFVLFSWHFSSFPVSLEAQVDLSQPCTSEHKKPGARWYGAPFIINWWMVVNARVTRTEPPITRYEASTRFFSRNLFLVFEVEKIFLICLCWTHCSPFMQIMSEGYAKTQCIARYISISIKAKIKSIKSTGRK